MLHPLESSVAQMPFSGQVQALVRRSLKSTAAKLIRVKRHQFSDAHRGLAGHLLHAVRHPVIPTRREVLPRPNGTSMRSRVRTVEAARGTTVRPTAPSRTSRPETIS